jgi:hypothetical protein
MSVVVYFIHAAAIRVRSTLARSPWLLYLVGYARPPAHPSRRSHSAVLPARPRWSAARLDQANEANYPNTRLAVQCRSDGDGLHAEMLRPRSGRHVEPDRCDILKCEV